MDKMTQALRALTLLAILAGCAARPTAPSSPSQAAPITPTLPLLILPTITAAPVTPPASAPSDVAALPTTAGSDVPSPTLTTHTVEAGDTLLSLALHYGVPMAAIQLQNDKGASTLVRLGEQLEIPAPAAWEGASPYWIVYSVNSGDTLGEIARTYGTTVGEIEAANGLSAADPIYAGQLLVLPLRTLAVARAPEPTPRPAPPTPAPWPYETVRLMNEVRASHGLPPLAYNETLAQAAQLQAADCAQRGWCSHTGSDGSDIKQRILRVGYNPASWAECWAQRQTPQGAIDIWMDEVPPNDPHRRTLLTTWLTEVGVGVAQTSWGYYFIADFGKPR
ncbi:MAG: Cell wall-binding protein YocH precursor [Chloroflexi bacterium ADurb.Bin222]|nr:MAG: Cell wall-binding protein YocH precursor [Chloroflexi bacterium ADurb.Bin222]